MNPKKAYRYILAVFVLGIAGSGWLVQYASTWLTESSVELTSLRSEVQQLEQKRISLEDAKLTLNVERKAIDTLSKVIPTDKDQARIVKEIYQIAAQSGLSIDSVGFPASTLGNQTAPATTVTATPATTGSDKPANSADAAATPVPTPPKSISQATPVKDIPGVQSIDLTIGTINSVTLPPATGVRYNEMIAFMKLIERNQRTIQIRSLGIGQGEVVNGEATFNLDIALTIFIRA